MRTFCSISDASVVVSLGCTLPPREAASDFQWRSRMPGLSSAVISGRLPLKSSSFSLMCSTTLSGPLRPVSPLASLYSWRPQLPTSASTCSGESCTNGPSSHVGVVVPEVPPARGSSAGVQQEAHALSRQK